MSATGLIIGGALSAAQMGYGWWQQSQAKKEMERLDANKAEVTTPEAVHEMRSRAERQYTEGSPLRDRREAQVRRSTAGSVRAMREGARSPMEYIQGVREAFRGELDAMNELAREDVMYRDRADERVYGAMGQEAQYDMRAQQSRREDWWRKYQTAAGMQQAGVQSVWSGAQTAATAGMQYDTQQMEQKRHDEWMTEIVDRNVGTMSELDAKRVWSGTFAAPSYENPWRQQPFSVAGEYWQNRNR